MKVSDFMNPLKHSKTKEIRSKASYRAARREQAKVAYRQAKRTK